MTRKKDPRTARLPVPAGELPDFAPVPRLKERHDGWTPDRQRGFIEALADTGSVEAACRAVDMAQRGAYELRRQPGAEAFRAAWEAALAIGVQRVEDVAMDRALNGVEEPVYSYGELVGTRIKYNDGLLMFILRNRAPERFAAGGAPKGLNAVSQMQLDRLKKQWTKEYEASKPIVTTAEVRASIERKFDNIQRQVDAKRCGPWSKLSAETHAAWAHFVTLRERDLDAIKADAETRRLATPEWQSRGNMFEPKPQKKWTPAPRPPEEEVIVPQWKKPEIPAPPPPKTEWSLKDDSFDP